MNKNNENIADYLEKIAEEITGEIGSIRLLSSEEMRLRFVYSKKLEEELFARSYRFVSCHELKQ